VTTTNYKVNDRLPIYTATLVQGVDRTPIDLTGATVVFRLLHTQLIAGVAHTVKPTNGTAVVVSGPAGTVSMTWAAGDLDTADTFDVEWIVTIDGKQMTVPSAGHDTIVVDI
jgi:hypothetical protein